METLNLILLENPQVYPLMELSQLVLVLHPNYFILKAVDYI